MSPLFPIRAGVLRLVLPWTLAIGLLIPVGARADDLADAQEATRLSSERRYGESLSLAQKARKGFASEGLYYLLLAHNYYGLSTDPTKVADIRQNAQLSYKYLLQAQQLAQYENEIKGVDALRPFVETLVRQQGIPLDAPQTTTETLVPSQPPAPAQAKPKPQPRAAKVVVAKAPVAKALAVKTPVAPARPRAARPRTPRPTAPALAKVLKLPPVKPKPGHIVGRAVKADGSPVPAFTVHYSGFEEGKLAASAVGGGFYETINSNAKGAGGRYAIAVPPGSYRATAYVTYKYRGRVYNFPMELLGPEPKYDYKSSQLETLRRGLVRNFVLKMTEKMRGASEETETVYRYAYYGGIVELDCGRDYGPLKALTKSLVDSFPPESRLLITLTPAGTRVDGSKNYPVRADFALGDNGKWTFLMRGVFPGLYNASAQLRLPTGEIKPLRLSTKRPETIFEGVSRVEFPRASTTLVDFLPDDLGPMPYMGVKAVRLYLGD